jgi:hypothetical protein
MKQGLKVYENYEYRDLRCSICHLIRKGSCETAVQKGFELRRRMLEDAFVYSKENKEILHSFCSRLNDAVISLYKKVWPLYLQLSKADMTKDITLVAKLRMAYPELHPIQDEEEQEVWDALQVWRYNSGFDNAFSLMLRTGHQEVYNEDAILQLHRNDEPWDEQLPDEWNQDLPLTMLFHHLHSHSFFSLYDLMFIRDIEGQLRIELDDITQKKTI